MIDVPFSEPSLGEEEEAAVVEVMRSGWISLGPRTRRFEEEFAAFVGTEHAVALNSCTAALHLSLVAMGIGPGDEVVTTPYTFCSTVSSVLHVGARPVLVDVDPATMNLDPAAVEAAITPRTAAVLAVHVAGHPADVVRLQEICDRHGVPLIEDCAHALPASEAGRTAGTWGEAGAFSFYATKNLTTGDGGMFVTSSPELAERVRRLAAHGLDRDAWRRYGPGGHWRYDVMEAGFKYHMTDLAAAIGLVQLRKQGTFLARRTAVASAYREALAGLAGDGILELPPEHPGHAWHLFIVKVDGRDDLVERLAAQGIGSSVHFIPVHLHRAYADLGYRPGAFPAAEGAFRRALSLPLHNGMSPSTAAHVASVLSGILAGRSTRAA
ncbi:MAG: DegT/DnrJ/EryC1/StrS family aminotransferase [Actinobacteria bacterium]|nr:DegT/DnrJ/EryC1/StrS family aminotransferase [Actinomycetota bacterium]